MRRLNCVLFSLGFLSGQYPHIYDKAIWKLEFIYKIKYHIEHLFISHYLSTTLALPLRPLRPNSFSFISIFLSLSLPLLPPPLSLSLSLSLIRSIPHSPVLFLYIPLLLYFTLSFSVYPISLFHHLAVSISPSLSIPSVSHFSYICLSNVEKSDSSTETKDTTI